MVAKAWKMYICLASFPEWLQLLLLPGEGVDVKALPSTSGSQYSLGGDLVDEYDPAKPNEYEDVVAERQMQRQEAEREVERQERLRQEAEVTFDHL